MKKIALLICFLLAFSPPIFPREEITELQEQTDALYRPSPGSGDGAFTALSSSMIGWGLGLATLIAIVVLASNASGN